MNRREFLKNALVLAALAPVTRITGSKAGAAETAGTATDGKVTRRKCGAYTLPMLGFGMMRLPRISGKNDIDYKTTAELIAKAIASGVNYFDTAYMYHGGKSEICAGDLLSKYPRNSYMLADKMPVGMLKKAADVERIFNDQLKKCKTPYFDFYLLHALNGGNWKKAKQFKVYEYLNKMKQEGKIKMLGFSFHDTPDVLDDIAKSYKWDFAQIQLNYLDWENYKSKEQYEILAKLNIPVIVMEPLRGGALATLNPKAASVLKNAEPDASLASWAFRYAGSLPNVVCILSGMNRMDHLEDNIKTFAPFKPLDSKEQVILNTALETYRNGNLIPCTDCRYCMPCPAGVNIPLNFSVYNKYKVNGTAGAFRSQYKKIPQDNRAAECVSCGKCAPQCPQKIDIPKLMKQIAKEGGR